MYAMLGRGRGLQSACAQTLNKVATEAVPSVSAGKVVREWWGRRLFMSCQKGTVVWSWAHPHQRTELIKRKQ